jgi:hypothetical protein
MVKILIAEDSITDSKYIESILKDKRYEFFLLKMERRLKIQLVTIILI